MLNVVHLIEKIIIKALIILMLVAIAFGTIELARSLIVQIYAPPSFLLDLDKLFETFGLVLVILIGIELLKSLEMFISTDKVKPELMVEVAVIALCNKIITLDVKHTEGSVILGIAALLVGLSVAYFVFRYRVADKKHLAKTQMQGTDHENSSEESYKPHV